ncbi:tryptophan-rich sensory protein [Pedococcus sp. 2YAF34]|uniref:tryptophan-rich sensory protein n=1 Tax=Pedococcus sp. 2YAF34 TaxID=3233032 RepID=UPI003F9D4BA9
MPSSSGTSRTVLVTGATGYVGGVLVPALLERGWTVRVLTRSRRGLDRKPWAHDVEAVEGDATSAEDCRRAMEGVDVAYYLLHSMDGKGDFMERDRSMARTFAQAAADAGVGRVVYLSGLHPEGRLSDHLASRVEVGDIFLAGTVPATVLQAGIVLGDGSASFDMLRHLTERLPAVVAPRWLRNRIQPIAVDDVVHYLAGSAEMGPEVNRTFDIGGPEVLTYAEMMQRYAEIVGLGRRFITTVPVLTPRLAGLWIDIVTPISRGIGRPLIGSLVHEAVCREQDIVDVTGPPPGGRTSFEDAIRAANRGIDPFRWRRTLARTSAMVGAAAVTGSVLTDPASRWYRKLDKPSWEPPPAAFPVVWTGLYADVALVSAVSSSYLAESGREGEARQLEQALALNMALNTAWTGLFFRAKRPWLATAECAVLTLSSADLARRAGAAGRGKAVAVGAYAAWCGFATVLSGTIAAKNRRGRRR